MLTAMFEKELTPYVVCTLCSEKTPTHFLLYLHE